MARNRQRAKDRKQRQSRDTDLGLPDAEAGSPGFPPLAGGAPPDDLGTAPPPVDFDDDDDDDDEEPDLGPGAGDVAAPVATRKGGVSRIVPASSRRAGPSFSASSGPIASRSVRPRPSSSASS